MRIAIVTGASSGLGREFVRQLDAEAGLDAIWAVARREALLREVAKGRRLPVLPVPLDLTRPESFTVLQELLDDRRPDVRILVNAAGLGKMGDTTEIAPEDERGMILLNCEALALMTRSVLPRMTRGAQILELASVAAFQPLPGLNVYAASKAFVLSYSRALRRELSGRGIHVTAVCPYWITDTEFIATARRDADPRAVRHFPLASQARGVVRGALRAAMRNRAVATPGAVAPFVRLCAKFLPHGFVIACWERLRRF